MTRRIGRPRNTKVHLGPEINRGWDAVGRIVLELVRARARDSEDLIDGLESITVTLLDAYTQIRDSEG